MEGKEYFDARFDGLKDLMVSQHANLTQHIGAVSRNVKDVASDLADHKESGAAHGLESQNKAHHSIIGWLGLLLAGSLGIKELVEAMKK